MWLIKHTFSLEICGWCFVECELPGNSPNQGRKGKLEIAKNPSSSGEEPCAVSQATGLPGLFRSLCIHTSLLVSFLRNSLPLTFFFCRSLTLLRSHSSVDIHPHLFLHCLAAVPAAVLFGPPSESPEKTPLGPACVFTLDHIMGSFQIRSMSSPLRVTAEHIFSVPGVLACPQTTER